MSKNKVNIYTCPRGHQTVTIDRHEGTTPFMFGCRHPGCRLMGQSSFYRCPQDLKPQYEWYKPNEEEVAQAERADPGMKGHADLGGLFVRRVLK